MQSTRLANVQFGDVTFKERFIVSDVTCPLLSLGSVLRAGWNIMHINGTPHLVKDDMKIAVMFRNNSLRARGQISMVSQQDPQHVQPGVRALQLGVVLRCLTHGWNRINPHLFPIRTVRPQHVNTTLCPSDELMWLRTTLVFREGSGWEIDEYCEAISEIQHNLEDEILFPDTVVEVITLAHKYAMEYEQLGFFMQDPSTANPANFEADDGSQYGVTLLKKDESIIPRKKCEVSQIRSSTLNCLVVKESFLQTATETLLLHSSLPTNIS